MSTLKMIEKAALSLPGDEQRELLVFLTEVINRGSGTVPSEASSPRHSAASALHPELLPMVGIIPAGADADEIHTHRLLKHS
jgi:hypothetical protein